jgi:hypothetical protein
MSTGIGDVVDSVEALPAFARDRGLGRYDVDEHSLDPFPGSNVSARAWGKVIHYRADGSSSTSGSSPSTALRL